MDEIHDELDQRIFNGIDPRPTKIKFIRNHFYDGIRDLIPSPEDYLSLYLTGSLTTYQYSDNSDCDISIFPDYAKLVEVMNLPNANAVRKALIRVVIDKLDGIIVPGTQHPVQHFVVLVDNKPQDLYKPGMRSAWSFQTESWFVAPEKDRVHNVRQELPLIYLRAHAIADKMQIALATDPAAARRLFERIHIKRTEDQRAGRGDFSEGNIVYKYLLHEGLFDRLREIGIYIAKTADIADLEKWDAIHSWAIEQTNDPDRAVRIADELTEPIVYTEGSGPPSFIKDQYGLWIPNPKAQPLLDAILRRIAGTPLGFDDFKCPECGGTDVYEDPEGGFECRHCGMAIVSKVADNGFSLKQTYADQYKYSYDGQNFDVWKVNMVTGDPHHFERIGPGHQTNAEGRIYYYGPNDIFHMIWTERGTPMLRQRAQRLVDQWCITNLGSKPTYTAAEELMGLDKEGATAPTQIIYDFNKDRIILGTKAEAGALPSGVIIGTYHDGHATMNPVAHQWLNTAYFKKLWLTSFPTWPLKGISLHGPSGPQRIATEFEPKKVRYIQAFVYFDPPINGLLTEPDATEHSDLIEKWVDEVVGNSPDYHPEVAEEEAYQLLKRSPKTAGHVGEFGSQMQYVAVFYSDFMRGQLTETLKQHALAKLDKAGFTGIIEAPAWAYAQHWYHA